MTLLHQSGFGCTGNRDVDCTNHGLPNSTLIRLKQGKVWRKNRANEKAGMPCDTEIRVCDMESGDFGWRAWNQSQGVPCFRRETDMGSDFYLKSERGRPSDCEKWKIPWFLIEAALKRQNQATSLCGVVWLFRLIVLDRKARENWSKLTCSQSNKVLQNVCWWCRCKPAGWLCFAHCWLLEKEALCYCLWHLLVETNTMQESLEEHCDKMVVENPWQVLAVHFQIKRRKFKGFRLIVDASKWNTVNPQCHSGTDVRCFLCTLFAEYECARKSIRKKESWQVMSSKTREFLLMREWCNGPRKEHFLFHTREIIVGLTELSLREPFLIVEILPKIDSHDKVVIFKNLEEFLKEIPEASKEHQRKCCCCC